MVCRNFSFDSRGVLFSENDITDVIDAFFTVQHNAFGEMKTYELKEEGSKVQVTEQNKREYVR